MKTNDVFQDILKDSNYDLSFFSEKEIEALRKNIFNKKIPEKYSEKAVFTQSGPKAVIEYLKFAGLSHQA